MSRRKTVVLFAALGLLFWVASTALQHLGGAFDNEFGGHPDEAAHFVTGVMVLEYLKHGFPGHPMRFAEDYYHHYPKVALGHYPPGFYILSALWSSLCSPARTSVFLFLGLLTAATACFTAFAGAKPLGFGASIFAAVLFLLLPLVQQYTSIFMSDMAVALACLLATLAFSKYLETENWKHAVAFGLLASAAILTKASGLLLALVPPIAIALSLKWHVLRRPSLWISGLIVAFLCLPWMLFTYEISSDGMVYEPGLDYTLHALWFFPSQLIRTVGWALAIPAGFAIGALLAPLLMRRRGIHPFWASMISLLFALILFYSLVPIDMDRRYLIPALPPALLLAALGVKSIATPIARRWFSSNTAPSVTALAALLVLVLFFFETFIIPTKKFTGFSAAVDTILKLDDPPPEQILISSDAIGEGAFIAELALREPSPMRVVHRASKTLAKSNWVGQDYQLVFDSAEAILEFLEANAIRWVVVDRSMAAQRRKAHHELLESALGAPEGRFRRAAVVQIDRAAGSPAESELLVFRRIGTASP